MLLVEADADAVIADGLSGQSPFTSTDVEWPAEPPAARESDVARPPDVPAPLSPVAAPPAVSVPLGFAHAIDLSALFDQSERDEAAHVTEAPSPRPESHEIDLSAALHDMKADQGGGAVAPSIESILKSVRDEALHEAASPEVAEQHFKLATTYIEMGMMDEAVTALEVSARSVRHRFRAGALLAKLHMDKGDKVRAVEWFERAAEAPAPSPAAAHQLLYELASALEAQGESARALAVLLELRSEAGEYRDLAQRLEHLMGG